MKVADLLESKRGWAYDMAQENKERQKRERESAKAIEKERLSKQREAAKPKKLSLDAIWVKVNYAINTSFPESDPIDHLYSWMDRYGLSMTDIDKACKLHTKLTYHKYLSSMWDACVDQAISDAEHELAWRNLKTKDEIIKGALTALKRDNRNQAKLIINQAREDGKDYPEFAAIEKSLGDFKAHGWHVPYSVFYHYDEKTNTFTKAPSPF